jgi:Tol biopolymer transport system component
MPPGWSGCGDCDPEWLPDGASLLLRPTWVIPIDGSTPHKLPWADRRLVSLTYSPDGSRVAYTIRTSLVVAAADGSNTREMWRSEIGDVVFEPVWSPSGDLIAFTSRSLHELHVLDVATGTVTLVAAVRLRQPFEEVVIDFSPHGDQILFLTIEGNPSVFSLWSVQADGSDLRRLATSDGWGDWQSASI